MDENKPNATHVEPSLHPRKKKLKHVRPKTHAEERANQWTHIVGAFLGVVALAILITHGSGYRDPLHVLSYAAFGVSLVVLYAASALYHSVSKETLKRRFKVLDHCAIYLLIAGTYTPFMTTKLQGDTGTGMLALVWALAFAGIGFKLFFAHKFKVLSTLVYLAMGWLVVFVMEPLVKALPPESLHWLVAGGLSYSIGVVFYLWDRLKFSHAIWHVFVLAGSACHFAAVLLSSPT